jgi:uncharacterized protein (TIGR02453 family)|tara:strand:+ start:5745 stop:6410 length:666 start_codon:yes stop_codon:yes gene_type:complete
MMIEPEVFSFLKNLAQNNNRPWFHENKKSFASVRQNIIDFSSDMESRLNLSDSIELGKLFRINRDVRFSKDKSPYKLNISGYFKRLSEERRGSYYFSFQPGETFIGGGFYGPNKDDTFRIRKEFEMDNTIESIVNTKDFKKYFGELIGEGVATAPRGFDKDHPNIQWIRKKQWYVLCKFTDEQVLAASFAKEVHNTYLAIRPFFDYMSEVLTTNLDGESIL